MFEWTNKVCIITGGFTRIGWAFVQDVVKTGAKVVMTDLEKVQEVPNENVLFFQGNLESAFEHSIQTFGKVDVLINCNFDQAINWPMKLQINLLVSIFNFDPISSN